MASGLADAATIQDHSDGFWLGRLIDSSGTKSGVDEMVLAGFTFVTGFAFEQTGLDQGGSLAFGAMRGRKV